MSRMSIKWKVTLWYAGMFVLLAALLFGFIAVMSDQLLRSESASRLEDAVWDFLEEIDAEDGSYRLDEDLRFYENGVVFSLYDEEGRLLAGSVPEAFPADTMLKAYAAQKISASTGKWTVYDAAVPCGNGRVLWVRGVYEADTLTQVERMFFRMLMFACPLLVLLALAVGYSITRRALLPIEEIRRTAEEIESGSDLRRRIPTERAAGEVRQLADTFNRMFTRLEMSFEKERQFTSDASHELRTPVSVILSQSEYALLPGTAQEEQREGLEVILKQAKGMSSLISELLFLARMDHGRERLEKKPLDIGMAALEALEDIRRKAAERRIELQPKIQPGILIDGDRDSLMRVFRNLLENAVQYGREGGFVRLSVGKEEGTVVCRVEDNGIGIGEEHLERIWDRFYRVEKSRSSAGNSGLGLSMVKWIVEEHGGTIEVESTPGRGSCFTIRL
ncbi:MAG: HAMP domain-containing histidine kinase [Clostridiales bacterium]|nr:HAMP domain-containing histidine kinase [Clostridiales bacterium]